MTADELVSHCATSMNRPNKSMEKTAISHTLYETVYGAVCDSSLWGYTVPKGDISLGYTIVSRSEAKKIKKN